MGEDEMSEACSTNWEEGERVWVVGRKDRKKETTRKTKT
jgi:hypothetical protein